MEKHVIYSKMKNEMEFLSRYCKALRMHSALYGEEADSLRVEDDVMDYLHYTKSILYCGNGHNQYENQVLNAIMKADAAKAQNQQNEQKAYLLFQGILQLPHMEKELLLELYVKGLDKKIILQHQGDIVESTFYRRLHKAYLHLYELLIDIDVPFLQTCNL